MSDDAIRDAKMKAAADLAAESHDAFMTATPSQLKAIMDANTQRNRDIAEQQAAWFSEPPK